MAIIYPLSLPASNVIRRFTMTAQSTNAITTSPFTKQKQIQTHQGMEWNIGVTLKPMKRVDADAWVAFLLKLNGFQGTFLIGDLSGKTAKGSLGGAPAVDGASQTGQVLSSKGWPVGTNGVLLAGDYIQLGTGLSSRLYKVLNDVDTDSAGDADIDIWPQLRQSPGDSDNIIVVNTVGLFRLASNIQQWDVDVAQYYGLGFSGIEVLQN